MQIRLLPHMNIVNNYYITYIGLDLKEEPEGLFPHWPILGFINSI